MMTYFHNELGNKIGLEVLVTPDCNVRVRMAGPTSVCDHTYTWTEAAKLSLALQAELAERKGGMMPDTPEAILPVIQTDRDAAANVTPIRGESPSREDIRGGRRDDHWRVQAFARHRLAHSPTSSAFVSTPERDMAEQGRMLAAHAPPTAPADPDDAYLGSFLREFATLVPGIDLQNAVDAGRAFLDGGVRDPVEDARSEASEWRNAS